ncbi:hypothetical protein G9P44_001634 [Scheffersomyces stipitis]|nr:hypothetical protein G9P44_001634 [Scheffersomyces stipitis]
MSSSPFLDNPGFEYSREVSVREDPQSDETERSYKQMISKLKYQLASARTEAELLEKQKYSMVSSYEEALLKKSEELSQLQTNFDYLFEEKKSLESKLDNQSQINLTSIRSLNETVDRLTKDNHSLTSKYNELESKHSRLVRKYDQVRSDFNFQLEANDQLDSQITNLKSTITSLHRTNDQLVEEMNQYSNKLSDDSSLNKMIENLHTKNATLQNINNQLQSRLDILLQNKTSNELLKSKNTSLQSKVQYLEGIEEKYYQLEIQKLEAERRFNDFFNIINECVKDSEEIDDDSTSGTKVKSFIETFKQLQYKYLVYKEKYDESQSVVKDLRAEIDAQVKYQEETLGPEMERLTAALKSQHEVQSKLERQKQLNVIEIEFLRKSLKELDELTAKKEKDSQDNKATNEYLTNLEKLVDDYKKEINSLQKQLQDLTKENVHNGNKRQKVTPNSNQGTFSQIASLEKENLHLSTQIKQLQGTLQNLQNKVEEEHTINLKKQQLQSLQYKGNLLAKDQIVKKQTLDALKKENEDLIAKYIRNETVDDLIPRSIFERQENDKMILQTKIDQLTNRNMRLRDVYAKKSKDILAIISKYFGYTISFLPNPLNPNDLSSRIKLVSRYSYKDSKDYLVIDIEAKSLKAYGDSEFKTLCEQLSSTWVKDKDQIPCLLSALNLKTYDSMIH